MSRIGPLFERLRAEDRLGLLTYITTGYPRIDCSAEVALALLDAGADMIELGVPFSDPLAEGRTVQRTSQVALRNGVNSSVCLQTAWQIRQRSEAPVCLMGYINPILAYGVKQFTQHAADAGVDGLIVPDLSLEEAGDLREACEGAGLDLVLFVAPTSTEERMRTVVTLASGFIYCVSVTGVTGSRESLGDDVDGMLDRVRRLTDTPLALGFGISRPEHLQRLRGRADAAIVGSALLEAMTTEDPAGSAAAFVRQLKGVD